MRERRPGTIDAGDAVSASVLVRMGAGELRISGGAASLLEAEFTTNRERWVPELEYRILGGRGRLEVRQRKGRRIFFGNIRNEWDLRLAGALPIDLEVKLGAGESRLDLSGVNLEALDVDMGVGELQPRPDRAARRGTSRSGSTAESGARPSPFPATSASGSRSTAA